MSIEATGPHQFSMGGWISAAPFERLLHITIVEASEGKATLTMPFLVDYANGAGIMHGGALVSLADTAVVMAIKSLLPAGSHFATIQLGTKFLLPVKRGMITARAQLVSRVDRIIEGQATLFDDQHRAVMEFTSTFKIAKDTRINGITFSEPAAPGKPVAT